MTLNTRFSTLAATAAIASLMAGCSTQLRSPFVSAAPAPAPAPASAAAPAAPPAPPPPAPRQPEGMGYAELNGMIGAGTDRRTKQDLVGKTVTLNLARAMGRDAPAGLYVAADGDSTYFRCRSAAGGFAGGEVTTQVSDYRYVSRGKQKIVDLDRCATVTAVAEPARPAAAPAPQSAAPAAPAAASGGSAKAGMDARGNVVDSSKVEAGSGRTVKGLNDYEGEITGNPAANGKFARLQIGMPVRQVTDIAGPPTDQGAYITGKAWIPFYFGADRHRFEMTYKGQGRLIFAGGGMGDFGSGYLIWIIHNPNEAGYR
ncbi:MAG: hypothetical protein WKG52_19020 [Variovorax sp.]